MALFAWPFRIFDTLLGVTGTPHAHTHTHTHDDDDDDGIYRASIASRGKNQVQKDSSKGRVKNGRTLNRPIALSSQLLTQSVKNAEPIETDRNHNRMNDN